MKRPGRFHTRHKHRHHRRPRFHRRRHRHVSRFHVRRRYKPSFYRRSSYYSRLGSSSSPIECNKRTIFWTLGIIFFIILVISVLGLAFGVIFSFSTLGWRQRQIDMFNSHVSGAWNHSIKEMAAISNVNVNTDVLSKSTTKKYDMRRYRSKEDDPVIVDYESLFFKGSTYFSDLSFYSGRTEWFNVYLDGRKVGGKSVQVFYEESYDCNCVEHCYSCRRNILNEIEVPEIHKNIYVKKNEPSNSNSIYKKKNEIRRYWDDDYDYDDSDECCYETCDTCYEYYRLSNLCLKIEPKNTAYSGICGGFPLYERTSSSTQSVHPCIEVRHKNDAELYFYESVTGKTSHLHWTDTTKIITGSILLGIFICSIIIGIMIGIVIIIIRYYKKVRKLFGNKMKQVDIINENIIIEKIDTTKNETKNNNNTGLTGMSGYNLNTPNKNNLNYSYQNVNTNVKSNEWSNNIVNNNAPIYVSTQNNFNNESESSNVSILNNESISYHSKINNSNNLNEKNVNKGEINVPDYNI